ncbi:ANTAR domain protein with unknown sensor [Kribbella flavida DSM 17836]|uniref:ANTAR domain-containing protein n=1 Tax=Kribbella flavida (strain DSM 17836 / JCM 10339 / NBRC 14399) TaxID=479435 RepID=D2PQA4_KRIFD|nr:GAF and ANTAR domain-containing protein [Kribbella flavida]ADB34806.1 ANTAR domain protein with unknown sensor [Kribbella flavida DSM 17836]
MAAERTDPADPTAVGALTTLLLSTSTIEQLLVEVARLAADVVVPPASCGVTSSYDGRHRSIATSDPRAALVDEGQYADDDGPCLEAMRRQRVVVVEDQLSEVRWPAYSGRAVKLGVRCSVSYPLVVQGQGVGALNLYGYDGPAGFSEQDRERIRIFAAQAAATLGVAIRFARQAEVAEQLEHALTSRSVIDQAIGVLMGQQHCDAETAFALLRTHSQNNNLKLRDVARGIIVQMTGHPPDAGHQFHGRGGGEPLSGH